MHQVSPENRIHTRGKVSMRRKNVQKGRITGESAPAEDMAKKGKR
jgi:hypothetical protein